MSDTALEIYEGTQISLHKPPAKILAEATEAANALKDVLQAKPNKVMFNGEQYLEREDWGTVAKFYGCTAKVIATRYVQYGDVTGWEAEAVCIDRNLNEIGRAESMCLSDEETWGDVPVYEWQDEVGPDGKKIWVESKQRYKSKKVKVGTRPKPQFQLRSMAQTRAEAKVLKSVFGWVVVLAGFKTTPAEEMTGDEHPRDDADEQREQVQQPTRESEKQQGPELVEITGSIESAKLGKEGAVWITLDKKIVMVKADLAQDTMAVGGKMRIKAIRKSSEKIPEWYFTVEVLESTAPPEGYKPPPEAATEEKQAEFAAQMDPEAKEGINLGELMDEKPEAEAAANRKKIGVSRAQNLYSTITLNKDKNNGFTDKLLKKIVAREPFNLEHVSDLTMDVFPQFQKLCKGDLDWRDLLPEDER